MAEKTTRLEVSAIPENMRVWIKRMVVRQGLSESGLVKRLLAAELTRYYGKAWHGPDGPPQLDHPEGDHDQDSLAEDE